MNRLYAAFLLLSVYLSGCATMAPGARDIRVTRDASSVASCKMVGTIDSGLLLDVSFHAGRNALQNVAITTGADTVLITSSRLNNWTKQGIGYRCAS